MRAETGNFASCLAGRMTAPVARSYSSSALALLPYNDIKVFTRSLFTWRTTVTERGKYMEREIGRQINRDLSVMLYPKYIVP